MAAALIGLPLAFWRSTTADRQSNTALEQSTTAITQVGIASQGLLNERYQKGAEMLGGSVLTVRLGGIYALQRLAEERPDDYHIQIMNLLGAFVRQPTQSDIARDGPVAMDVQEAMNAIVHRSHAGHQIERDAEYVLDLSGANLIGVNLEDANLSGAMLDGTYWGTASLAGVDLSDTSLNHASFFAGRSQMEIHRAKMRRADLTDAGLSDVRLVDVDLSGAHLDRAILSRATLTRTDMTDASLTETVLNGARFVNVKGLDQQELTRATADIDNPPTFMDCVDSRTGEELVWRPRSGPRN